MNPGRLLRTHRRRRRLSQLELALAAGISSRHLSFIENGRSRPGRAVLAALARALQLPLRESNRLFRAAGERAPYPDRGLDDAAAASLRSALERMLEAHMPWPAMVTDRCWHPVRTNPAFDALLAELGRHAQSGPGERGMMEWLFAHDGLRPLVANWDAVGPFLLERVRHEAVLDPGLEELLERLEATGEDRPGDPGPARGDVVLPLHLVFAGQSVQLFSLLAGFGSALDAGLQDLRMEFFCPNDAPSAQWLRDLTAARPA